MQTMIFLLCVLLVSIMTTIAGVGATLIITKSFIFEWLQHYFDPEYHHWQTDHPYLNKLFNCPTCVGWYVGVLFQFLTYLLVSSMLGLHLSTFTIAVLLFFQGFITSLFSIYAYLVLVKLGIKTVK